MPVEAVADLWRNIAQVECLVHRLLRYLGVGCWDPVCCSAQLRSEMKHKQLTCALYR